MYSRNRNNTIFTLEMKFSTKIKCHIGFSSRFTVGEYFSLYRQTFIILNSFFDECLNSDHTQQVFPLTDTYYIEYVLYIFCEEVGPKLYEEFCEHFFLH